MIYLLDINICIMRRQSPHVLERFQKEGPGRIGLSSVSVAELSFGMEKSKRVKGNLEALEEFLFPLTVYAFDKGAAHAYGGLRRRSSAKVPPSPPWIPSSPRTR